jgi:FkbM family methyltransferase
MKNILTKLLSIRSWSHVLQSTTMDVAKLGISGAAKASVAQVLTILLKDFHLQQKPRLMAMRPRPLIHPLIFRSARSDVYVIRQVLVEEEYVVLKDLRNVQLIIDCGANIGCSSAYFLSVFPTAKVIAVEPDRENFAILSRNLKPYGSRAHAICAAVWPDSSKKLQCVKGAFADGLDWACTVRVDVEGDTEAVTIEELLKGSGRSTIDLLKVDIEGAERDILAAGKIGWLEYVRNLCIELHGEESSALFDAAMGSKRFKFRRSGEISVCRDIS